MSKKQKKTSAQNPPASSPPSNETTSDYRLSPSTNFTVSANVLGKISQYLHRYAQILKINGGQSEQPLDTAPSPPPNETESKPEPDQIRSYLVPGHIVCEERELLSEHEAEDLSYLFTKVLEELYFSTIICDCLHDDEISVDEYIVVELRIEKSLHLAYDLLNKIYSIFVECELQPSVANGSV